MPIKRFERAKTRLALPAQQRRALVRAFLQDTAAAVLACVQVERLILVAEDPAEVVSALRTSRIVAVVGDEIEVVRDLTDPRDLNASVSLGVTAAGRSATAVMPADLPTLTAQDLAEALQEASKVSRGVLCDWEQTGTVLLTARAVSHEVHFGQGSYALHQAAGYQPLNGCSSALQADVDTVEALRNAIDQGVGPATLDLFRQLQAEALQP